MLSEERRAEFNSMISNVINARRLVESEDFRRNCDGDEYELALLAQHYMERSARSVMEALERDSQEKVEAERGKS